MNKTVQMTENARTSRADDGRESDDELHRSMTRMAIIRDGHCGSRVPSNRWHLSCQWWKMPVQRPREGWALQGT